MMADALPPEESDARVELIFETVGRPARAVSLYYTLYYLAEHTDVDVARHDFRRVRDRLDRGFYWYGVVSVTKEFANAYRHFHVNGWTEEMVYDRPAQRARLREYARSKVPAEYRERFDYLWKGLNSLSELSHSYQQSGYEHLLNDAEYYALAVSKPGEYVDMIAAFFENTRDLSVVSGQAEQDNRTGWADAYNGAGWTGITRHLQRRESLATTAWVDQSWQIEHNTGTWLDGLDTRPQDIRAVSNAVDREPGHAGYNSFLSGLLDDVRETDFSRVYAIAREWNEDVDVDLSRRQYAYALPGVA